MIVVVCRAAPFRVKMYHLAKDCSHSAVQIEQLSCTRRVHLSPLSSIVNKAPVAPQFDDNRHFCAAGSHHGTASYALSFSFFVSPKQNCLMFKASVSTMLT